MLFLLLALLILINRSSFAIDHTPDELMSWLTLTPKTATPDKVTAILGKPAKVEENKKHTWWYYTHGNTSLVISWNNKSAELEKFSFSCNSTAKCVFDNAASRKLKSGITDLGSAIKILGVPKDMTVKSMTQEVHYAYEKCVLRLFFRNRTLVDYTMVAQ